MTTSRGTDPRAMPVTTSPALRAVALREVGLIVVDQPHRILRQTWVHADRHLAAVSTTDARTMGGSR